MSQTHWSRTHDDYGRLDFLLLQDGTLLFSPFDKLEDDLKGEDGEGFETGTPIHHFAIHSGDLAPAIDLIKAAQRLCPDNDFTIEKLMQAVFAAGVNYGKAMVTLEKAGPT